VGGAYRGPVGVGRQRRTIRFMQGMLLLIAAGLLCFAGYSYGVRAGFEDGVEAEGALSTPRSPSISQTVVLFVLGVGALGGALGLQTEGGVRLLTPARLREMEEAGAMPIVMEEGLIESEAQTEADAPI
jgi:hypothetical protein